MAWASVLAGWRYGGLLSRESIEGRAMAIFDNHFHLRPTGLGIEAAKQFEGAGGTALMLTHSPYDDIPIRRAGVRVRGHPAYRGPDAGDVRGVRGDGGPRRTPAGARREAPLHAPDPPGGQPRGRAVDPREGRPRPRGAEGRNELPSRNGLH